MYVPVTASEIDTMRRDSEMTKGARRLALFFLLVSVAARAVSAVVSDGKGSRTSTLF